MKKIMLSLSMYCVSLAMSMVISVSLNAMASEHKEYIEYIKYYYDLQERVSEKSLELPEFHQLIGEMSAMLDAIEHYSIMHPENNNELHSLGFAPEGDGQLSLRRIVLQDMCMMRQNGFVSIIERQSDAYRYDESLIFKRYAHHIVQYSVLSQAGVIGEHEADAKRLQVCSEEEFTQLIARTNNACYFGNTCGLHALKNAICLLTMESIIRDCGPQAKDDSRYHALAKNLSVLTENTQHILELVKHHSADAQESRQTISSEDMARVIQPVVFDCLLREYIPVVCIAPDQIVIVPEIETFEQEAELIPGGICDITVRAIQRFKDSDNGTQAFIVLLQEPGQEGRGAMSHWVTVLACKRAGVASFILTDSNQEHTNQDVLQRLVVKGLISKLQ
jgi:hypothetical protein